MKAGISKMAAESDTDSSLIAEVVVGTYQEFVLGFQLLVLKSEPDDDDDDDADTKENFILKQSFTNHSHCGSIRSLTTVGKYIVSGSTDEVVRLLNISTRSEHGYLQQQNGTITCLSNYESTHLFSGSDDGSICVWRTGNWECEKTLKGHQGGVVGIAVHPSGKLALSIAKDKSLRTWNLVKGRCGYVTNLKAVADFVQWSPEGTVYAIGISNRVDIYAVQSAQVIYSIPFGKRITSICFASENIILVAGDQEQIEVHNIKKAKSMLSFVAHKNRVKDMKYLAQAKLLVTVSNDGFIKVWDFRRKKSFSTSPKILTQTDTSCRITCLTLWSPPEPESIPEEPIPETVDIAIEGKVHSKKRPNKNTSTSEEPKKKRKKEVDIKNFKGEESIKKFKGKNGKKKRKSS